MTQLTDRQIMKFTPIQWAGAVRKKGDWLPRWEEVFVTLDGVTLRVFESKSKFLDALERDERARLPAGSPPSRSSMSMANRSTSQRTVSMTSIPTHKSAMSDGQRPSDPSIDPTTKDRKGLLTLTGVAKESVGRPHGLCISTRERKALHVAVDTELERVVWLHLLAAALEQQAAVAKTIKPVVPVSQVSTSSSTLLRSLVNTPIRVDLRCLYDAYGHIVSRKGNFADLVPSLHPNVSITSNYPPSVPIAGAYHGRAGVLAFLAALHATIDVSHFTIQHVARNRDLAVVTGRETLRSIASGRKFRHVYTHELRFESDGRISHIHILGDKTAAAVAFNVQTVGPSLALPHDQEVAASTCPPGELRVVCISGDGLKRRKPIAATANVRVTVGLNDFPHVAGGSGAGSSISSNSIGIGITNNGGNTTNGASTGTGTSTGTSSSGSSPNSHVGFWKAYSTRLSKNGSSTSPFWAETLAIQFSGAVPGTPACLYVDVWSVSVMGDELVGCVKVNLASFLETSAGSDEDVAALAIPTWYDLRKPDDVGLSSSSSSSGCESVTTTDTNTSSCGRLQLSISFLPYTDDDNDDNDDNDNDDDATPRHRKSLDRLQALHDETSGATDRRLSIAAAATERDISTSSSDDVDTNVDTTAQRRRTSSSSSNSNNNRDDMYSFTVASTTFRVYTRYQLIRAIGHGAYGVVIAASDQVSGQSVAIKNIPKTFDDLVDAKRIVREIRLMRHLQHRNIVSVRDVMRPPSLATFDDTYIVTDLMETDLHRVIASSEALARDHIAFVAYQLLCAIRYMHSAHILHRDIKPSNILINRDCLVKICDFGLARGIDIGTNADTNAGTNPDTNLDQALTEYVVTRWYRAPELLLASKYTPAIDLWSIGCILVELFTRKALFPGHDHVHQLHLILQVVGSPSADAMGFITNAKARKWLARQATHAPKALATVCPTAPPDALDLIQKLLAFDPRARISADDAIAHPFVAAFRDTEVECTAPTPFDFAFERERLDKDALRRLIFEDVCHFHPDALPELERFKHDLERRRAMETAQAAAADAGDEGQFADAQQQSGTMHRAGIA